MATDDEIIADIEKAEASENKQRGRGRPPKEKEAPVVAVSGDPDRRVWVRCITDLAPWFDDQPLSFWGVYSLKMCDAQLMEHRRHGVILEHEE